MFSSEMVKNGFCFGGASKQNALFLEDVPWKSVPMSQYMDRDYTGRDYWSI